MTEYFYSREGAAFHAASPIQVVEWFRSGARFCADETIPQYMKGCADREKMFSSKVLRFDTPENFVADLLKCGILAVLEG
jgi:hypothetical protein